jgi:predicted nucleotidyltransferase component of viral defense system
MLAINQILNYAQQDKLSRHILQEYFQHEILDSFFRQEGSLEYSFIGGTAIRLMYGGQRFSEDLDFDTTNIEAFDHLLELTIKDMRGKGFEIDYRLIHKGAYHCHIKFPEVLHTYGLSGYKEEKLLVKFDAAPFDRLYANKTRLGNYGIYRQIHVAPPSVLLAKKLLTVQARRRPKGRDLYDITWLWGMGSPDEAYLRDIGQTTAKKIVQELSQYVKTLNLDDLVRETSNFLIKKEDSIRITSFPDYIDQKLLTL